MPDLNPFLELWSVAPPLLGDDPVPNAAADRNKLYRSVFGTLANGNARLRVWCDTPGGPAWQLFEPAQEESYPKKDQNPFSATVQHVAAFRLLHHKSLSSQTPGTALLEGLSLAQQRTAVTPLKQHGPFLPDALFAAQNKSPAFARLCQTLDWLGSFARLELAKRPRPELKDDWWLQFRFPFLAPLLGGADGFADPGETGRLDPTLLARITNEPIVSSAEERGRFETFSPNAAHQREAGVRRTPFIAGGLASSNPEQLLESFAVNATGLSSLHGHLGQAVGEAYVALEPKLWPEGDDRLWKMVAVVDGYWWARANAALSNVTIAEALQALTRSATKENGPQVHPVLAAPLAVSPIGTSRPAVTPRVAILEFLGLKTAAAPAPAADAALQPNAATAPFHYLHTRPVENGTRLEWRRWVPLQAGNAVVPVLIRVRQALAIEEWVELGGTGQSHEVVVEGLADTHALQIWSRYVGQPLRDAARQRFGRGAIGLLPDPIGAVPDPTSARLGGTWALHIKIKAPVGAAVELMGSQVQPAFDPDSVVSVELRQASRRPTGAGATPDWFTLEPAPAANAPVAARCGSLLFHDLLDHGRDPLELVGGEVLFDTSIIRFRRSGGGFLLETPHKLTISHQGARAGAGQTLAIGGLDLQIRPDTTIRGLKISIDSNVDPLLYHVGVDDAPLTLPLRDVEVGGSDDREPIDRQPLVWSKAPVIGEGELVCEDFAQGSDRISSLAIRLSSDAAGADAAGAPVPPSRVTIIDPAPMSIATVMAPQLTRAKMTDNVVATWQTREGRWRIVSDSSEAAVATIVLPPQGVAEAWERSGGATPNPSLPDQIAEGQRVPARLTPTARIVVETEERPRNPVAPWNLRRLMSDIDVDLPGARLVAIDRIEGLYGLEARAAGLAGLRIAETAGWRGVVRRPLRQPEGGPRFARWNAAAGVFERRLAILDVRAEAAPLAEPVIDGVAFRIRPEGRYVEPLARNDDGSSRIGEPWTWTPADAGGILGGALAGFEHPTAIEALLRDAPNGRGQIDGLMLSALGAWTGQRAAFDNGLSLIAVGLQMGRVDEARFERKGRIGATHHLAKHVIVYRRSFLPTRQFEGEQDAHRGRPIVRKAEEYIEITQPVRRYPDRAGAVARDGGPVLGCQFRTVRIPVSGSWAQNLPGDRLRGYFIPLWQPDADNGIYPRPVVEMLLAGDPARAAFEPVARRIENPDALRFYTLTDQGTPADVDTWPNVYGLDFEDRPLDDPLDNALLKSDFQAEGDPGKPLPDAVAIPPGLERFTLRLEQGPGVNLCQGRFDKPIVSDLRTLTLMRAAAIERPAPAPAAQALRDAQHARSLVGGLADLARQSASDIKVVRAEARKQLQAIAARLPDEAELGKLFDTQTNAQKLMSFCSWLHEGGQRIDRLATELVSLRERLPNEAQWEAGRLALLGELARAESQLLALLDVEGLLTGVMKGPIAEAGRLRDAVDREAKLAMAAAKRGIDDAGALVKVLSEEVKRVLEAAAKRVTSVDAPEEVPAEVRAALAAAEVRAALAAAGAQGRRLTVTADEVERASRDVGAALDRHEAKLRKLAPNLAKWLIDKAEALRRRSANAAHAMRDLQLWLNGRIDEGLTLVAAFEHEADRRRQDLANALTEAATRVADEQAKIDKALTELAGNLDKAVADASVAIGEALAEAEAQANSLKGVAVAELNELLEGLLAPVRRLAAAAVDQPYPKAEIDSVRNALDAIAAEWKTVASGIEARIRPVCEALESADEAVKTLIERGRTALAAWIGELDAIDDVAELIEQVGDFASALDQAVGQISQGLGGLIDDAVLNRSVTPASLAEDVALNLLRAAGAPPVVEQLVFNRDQLAYHFQSRLDAVVTTPVTALLDQGEAVLRGMGVALPTLGLRETLLAPVHDAFAGVKGKLDKIELDAKDVLKDFAGLKDMLPKLKFDGAFAQAIKITHDYDASRRVAWLQGAVNWGPKTAELFSAGSFAVIAERMSLNALSRYERALSGEERRQVTARLKADWALQMGGTALVRIREALVDYDDRKGLSFDVKPQNIEFAGALQLLTNALKSFNKEDQPLSIELIEDNGRPVGLKSRFDMPPTTFSFGAVTILNASLGVHLDLAQRSEFEIRLFAYFGRHDQPFSLVVGWLGGGGYLEAEAIHRPRSNATEVAVALSIGACAGVGFNFGPLAGHIQVYLGFRASYRSGPGGARLNIAAVIVISGSVTAWGFVTVSLGMTLAITYEGNKVVGRGHVKVSVRISRFYKKRFSRPINYKLGG